jgi:hypothetical protein
MMDYCSVLEGLIEEPTSSQLPILFPTKQKRDSFGLANHIMIYAINHRNILFLGDVETFF